MNPIIALATPPLPSALALIRLSGDGVFALTEEFLNKKITPVAKRNIVYGGFSFEGKLIDLVVCFLYPGPNSMTGEDVVEISCHGSMVIVNQIISAYLAKGVSLATRGEFSSRAFYNGKMDLIEAESVNDLISATTVEAKNLALMSVSGKTSQLVTPLKEEIASLMSLLEVGIDFPEYEDIESLNRDELIQKAKSIRERIASLIEKGDQGALVRKGVNVALVGEPNVGKSSLLNALLGKEKAIVSDIPGTTRDVVECDISIHGVPVHLLDTAGLRKTEDKLESLGVKRSFSSIEEADLVVLVLDEKEKESPEILSYIRNKKTIKVINKADLLPHQDNGKIYVSASKGEIEPLKEAIYDSFHLDEDVFITPSLSSPRQLALLRKIDEDLKQAIEDAENGQTEDLISVHLLQAYNASRQLLGEEPTQDLTDEIFSRFCVGK